MPRTDNQKVVTAYLPPELYDKLEQFKLEQGLKSDSKVINAVLERWFFGEMPTCAIAQAQPEGIAKTNHLEERLSQVEKTCATLIEQVTGLTAFNAANVPSELKLSKGLGQRALAKRLGCTHQWISDLLVLGNLGSWSQTQDPQGLSWELRDGKFYPCNLEADKSAS